jgi:hypothetical protein
LLDLLRVNGCQKSSETLSPYFIGIINEQPQIIFSIFSVWFISGLFLFCFWLGPEKKPAQQTQTGLELVNI